jgi:uncharacterized protein involved in exopolysaccharide biosynthesis
MISNNENSNEIKSKMDLINFLKFLWRWKLIIFPGTVVFILGSAIVSYTSPKLYSVEIVINPGILRIHDDGQIFYVDTSQTILTLINGGFFKNNINKKIKKANSEASYVQSRIRAMPKKKTNIIIVRYDTLFAEEGKKILNILIEELSEYYSDIVNRRKDDYQKEIDDLQSEVNISKINEENKLLKLEYLEKRISELISELNRTEEKIEELNSLIKLKTTTKDNNQFVSMESLYYSLYQLIDLHNDYTKQLDSFKENKIVEKIDLASMHEIRNRKLDQIERLKNRMGKIKAIQIISFPKSKNNPIKANIYLKIFLFAVFGFIFTILLSLIIEYLMSKKRQKYFDNK